MGLTIIAMNPGNLRNFLEPRSVAIVGARPREARQPCTVLENLLNSGWRGKIYPVNPNYDELLGLRCYRGPAEIPEKVDLAVVTTSRGAVPAVVRECAEHGIRSAIVVSNGFADAGPEGRKLQDELASLARSSGVRILGPNTVGAANAFTGFTTSPYKQTDFRKRPIGVVCQTGMFFGTLGRARLLGKGLDIGNAADVDLTEAMEHFAEDPDVKVIVLHIEGAADARRFMESASRVVRRKPVVAMKTARSEQAALTAQTHTGSMVGSYRVWDAALRQCGIIRASNPSELGDLARAFAYLPLMRGRGTGIISGSGGVGIMATDACAGHGLGVPRLSSTLKQGLRDLGPSWFKIENPVDLWPVFTGSNRPLAETLDRLLRGVLAEPEISGVVLFAGAWFESLEPPLTEVVGAVADAWPGKPIALCPYDGWVYDITTHDLANRLEETGKGAVFSIPEEAVAALAALADYAEFLRDCQEPMSPGSPDSL